MSEKQEKLLEYVISVNRVTKVVKGGRIMGFAVLVVVGNANGSVGMGSAKAKEVSIAVLKAIKDAGKNLVKISLNKDTIYHEITAKHGATKVFMQPASVGTGIIAGGAMRAIFEAVGIQNICAKIHGSSNPYNVVRATINALTQLSSPAEIAAKRSRTVTEIVGRA